MEINLPIEPLFVLYKLQQAGYDGYIVGGAVRDLFIHSFSALSNDSNILPTYDVITDFDFTTNATPEQIQAVFPENFYENAFGTVSVTEEHLLELMIADGLRPPDSNLQTEMLAQFAESEKIIDIKSATKVHESLSIKKTSEDDIELPILPPFEITTYRSEGIYENHRKPAELEWGASIEDDLKRRDFTINAMALSISHSFLQSLFSADIIPSFVSISEEAYKIIDPHNGFTDLTKKIITTVGNDDRRFQEDALRMLRGIRFAVQLDMNLDIETLSAIEKNAKLITHISWERIRDEILKMLISSSPKQAIELLDQTGLLQYILPELLDGKNIQQAGHHTTDVWTHSIDAVDTCPSDDPIVKFATLLHDIGKPATYRETNGSITFYNHEIIGSRIASKIAKRFKLSKIDVERIFILVRYHMFHYQEQNTDASIRRFMKKVGLENIDDILALREGDRLGSGAKKTSWRLEEMKQRMISQLHQPMSIQDLAINGNDLMKELNLKPGKILGKILNYLFEEVMDDPNVNQRETLFQMAREYISNN